MKDLLRWDPCISHTGKDAENFISSYFSRADRQVLIIAGAGFDPRTTLVADLLSRSAKQNVRAFLLRENRPNPSPDLVARADANIEAMKKAFSLYEMHQIEIFSASGTIVGGRNTVQALRKCSLTGATDIVVDASALSIGICYPVVRYLLDRILGQSISANLHLMAAHDPALDDRIRSISGDTPSYVHGFKGGSTLDEASSAAKLWLPQLATGRRSALTKLHNFVEPHDTCPILPFPASHPRVADQLAEEFLTEFEESWAVDSRDIVFADEEDPLDLYRTILRLDDLRKPVFAGSGGSMLILSPLGSRVMALGALMAALERALPVAYLESIGYELKATSDYTEVKAQLLHIWLEGDAYPKPRPQFGGQPVSV